MGLENTPTNSKACVKCNNVEGDLTSVRLEGLQSLTEYSKIRSNANLLNYRTEQVRNNMPNEVYSSMRIVDVSIPALYGKNRNKKILLTTSVLNQLFFDQTEKVLIEKRISFSVKKYML